MATGIMLKKPNKDESDIRNYRPISLISAVGKIFEKIIAGRATEYYEQTHFLNDWQRAYRKNREAGELVACLMEEVRTKEWKVSAFSLDVEKAFDTV